MIMLSTERALKRFTAWFLFDLVSLSPPARRTIERTTAVDRDAWGDELTDLAFARSFFTPLPGHFMLMVPGLAGTAFLWSYVGAFALLLMPLLLAGFSALALVSFAESTNAAPTSVFRVLRHSPIPARAVRGVPAKQLESIMGRDPNRSGTARLERRIECVVEASLPDEASREAFEVLMPNFTGTTGELLDACRSF